MSFDATSVSKVFPKSGLCDTTQYKIDADVSDNGDAFDVEDDVPGFEVSIAKLRECDCADSKIIFGLGGAPKSKRLPS